MKLNINNENLYELSNEEIEVFVNIIGQKISKEDIQQGRGYCINHRSIFPVEIICEKATVGKLIEILEVTTRADYDIINEGGRYCITFKWYEYLKDVPVFKGITGANGRLLLSAETEYHNEICDALWEAVKKIISYLCEITEELSKRCIYEKR